MIEIMKMVPGYWLIIAEIVLLLSAVLFWKLEKDEFCLFSLVLVITPILFWWIDN